MRATKLIPGIKDLPYVDRLQKLQLPSLAHRRLRDDAIQTFKIIKSLDDCNKEKFFTLSTMSNTRGHSYKLEKPRCETNFALNQFSNRVVNVWNALPQVVVSAKTVEDFKILLDRHFPENMKYKF